jgi:rod shape determining protein RodA
MARDVKVFLEEDKEEKTLLKRFFVNMDWLLLASVALLVGIGIISIYSATLHLGFAGKYVMTQTIALCIGVAGMMILLSFNYQLFNQFMPYIYGFSIMMLMSVLIFGTTVKGTRGWFHFGGIAFQPVEVARIIFILVLASYLDSKWRDAKRFSVFAVSCLFLLGHFFLIMLQPDFSGTLPYLPITFFLLYIAGVQPIYLLAALIFGGFAVGLPLLSTFLKLQPALLKLYPALNYIYLSTLGGMPMFIMLIAAIVFILLAWWFLVNFRLHIPAVYVLFLCLIVVSGSLSSIVVQKSLKEYQRKRLVVFIKPDIDPLGSGYNIIQSKIAIGSGRVLGKGLFSGTQSQLGYLPEQHTDFIFSVIGEELGYFISQLTIILYFILVWRAMIVSREARDRYGSLVAAGIGSMFAFFGTINIGMVMGLMPTTGLPLSLVSYGGSSIACSLWAVGLLLSIHIRRFTH